MSFFPSLMGDFDDDPFMGHMRQMNRMMSSFFGGGSPFGAMMGGGGGPAAMIGGPGGGELMPFGGGMRGGAAPGGALMPFGFPDMSQLFQNGAGGGNCHSFASSTITTMSNGPDGQPQVYQASQSVRSGPGGVKETKKSVADSRSGIKKMAIGHHIGDRAHIIEREHNVRSGEHIENQEYINLEEEEAPEFNQEWQQKSRSPYSAANAISYHGGPAGAGGRYSAGAQRSGYTSDNLAIMPPPPPSSSSTSSSARSRARMNRKTHSSAIPSSSRGRHAEREAEQHHNEEEEEEEDEEDDEEECGVKIVEVDDDDYEDNVNRNNGEDAATEEDNNAEPVIYVTEDTGSSRGVPGGEKGAHRSRGKKRSHEPEPEVAHKSQKFQNRP